MWGVARHVGAGLVAGVVTGLVARGFMALLTEDPEFTWAGTSAIVAVFAIAGLVLAVVHTIKLRGRARWWKLLALPAAVIGLGPGMLLVAPIVGTALVLSRNRWARGSGCVVLLGFIATLPALMDASDISFTARTVAGLTVMLGVSAAVGAGVRAALTGWAPRRSAELVPAGEAQPDRGQRSEGGGHGGSAEDPLDLHDGGVEQRLGVGLVG